MHSKPKHRIRLLSSKTCFSKLAFFFTSVALILLISHIATAENPVFEAIGTDNRPSPENIERGWISLFDGETLFGWKAQSNADWKVSDGTIKATRGDKGLLRTTTQFSNYELSVDFKATAQTNSGVFLRTSPAPKNATDGCYEINIAPETDPFPTGSIVEHSRVKQPIESDDQWHNLRMIISGDLGEVFLDGQKVSIISAGGLGRGYIGLQFRKHEVQFRNIFLNPLDLKPLLTNKGLDKWISDGSGETTFTINEAQQLQMQSGPGQLESKQHFADFVLSAKIKTNAKGLNSGIFFRCIPGEKMNGYESQIQNQMVDGDPTKPFDCGTGGIFRRQNARRIVAQDKQWFYKTIVAVGPHISVWVNGYQVTDWTDKRKPDANPRRGLRLSAGSIMLQGHDPTTDVLFEKINAAELLPRR